jgi:hypothetical protein
MFQQLQQLAITVTIDCNNKPKLKITRSKESWKNLSRIVATNDCNNKPTPKIARNKESWKNASTTTTTKVAKE